MSTRKHTEIVTSFRQFDEEILEDAWRRMKDILEYNYGHNLHEREILEIFYYGLKYSSTRILNCFSKTSFLELSNDQAFQILENLITPKSDCRINNYTSSDFCQNDSYPEESNSHQNDLWDEKFEQLQNKQNQFFRCFKQLEGETLGEAWLRMKELRNFYYYHNLKSEEIYVIFYCGLNIDSKMELDEASGDKMFLSHSADDAFDILFNVSYQRRLEYEPNDSIPIFNSHQTDPCFEFTDIFQENLCPENSNVFQENLLHENIESSSSNFNQSEPMCENPEQSQNDFYQENHDFSPSNSKTCFDFQSSNSYQENFEGLELKLVKDHSKKNDTELEQSKVWTLDDLKEFVCHFYESTCVENSEIYEECIPYNFKGYEGGWVDSDFVKNDDEIVVERSILIPEPVEDDFTDDEIEDEDVLIVPEVVKNEVVKNEEDVPNEDKFSKDDDLDVQLQELLDCDLGECSYEEITIEEFNAILDMDIEEFSQWIEKPQEKLETSLEELTTDLEPQTFPSNLENSGKSLLPFVSLLLSIHNQCVFVISIVMPTVQRYNQFLSTKRELDEALTTSLVKRCSEHEKGVITDWVNSKSKIEFYSVFKFRPPDILSVLISENSKKSANLENGYFKLHAEKLKGMVYHVPRPPDYFDKILCNLWYTFCQIWLGTLIAVGTHHCRPHLNSSVGGEPLIPGK